MNARIQLTEIGVRKFLWWIIEKSQSKREKQKKTKETEKRKKIVAKALDGQRYPCPA